MIVWNHQSFSNRTTECYDCRMKMLMPCFLDSHVELSMCRYRYRYVSEVRSVCQVDKVFSIIICHYGVRVLLSIYQLYMISKSSLNELIDKAIA